MTCPNYLADYADQWNVDPRQANLAWFADADYGLFLHYGLYSQLGKHEWEMYHSAIPVAEYEKLAESFNPSKFDADFITDLACEGGMKYVNLTSCHHEGFCLWDSQVEPFNSMQYAKRDLVRELAEQCDKKGLGFFTYYTHVLNWRHPYAMMRDLLEIARPDYPNGDPAYKLTRPEEWRMYWDYAQACLVELCGMDLPMAGPWLDIIVAYYMLPDDMPIEETYAKIRAARPEALISFKQGATGTEDFAAPEFSLKSQHDRMIKLGYPRGAEIAEAAWQANRTKHNEICITLQEGSWGWKKDAPFRTAEELWDNLGYARANNCNLLANIGPKPDGSLPEESAKLLREVGRRIREHGMPSNDKARQPERKNNPAGGE